VNAPRVSRESDARTAVREAFSEGDASEHVDAAERGATRPSVPVIAIQVDTDAAVRESAHVGLTGSDAKASASARSETRLAVTRRTECASVDQASPGRRVPQSAPKELSERIAPSAAAARKELTATM